MNRLLLNYKGKMIGEGEKKIQERYESLLTKLGFESDKRYLKLRYKDILPYLLDKLGIDKNIFTWIDFECEE